MICVTGGRSGGCRSPDRALQPTDLHGRFRSHPVSLYEYNETEDSSIENEDSSIENEDSSIESQDSSFDRC